MAIAAGARLTIADSSAVLKKPKTGTNQTLNKTAPRHEPARSSAYSVPGRFTTGVLVCVPPKKIRLATGNSNPPSMPESSASAGNATWLATRLGVQLAR